MPANRERFRHTAHDVFEYGWPRPDQEAARQSIVEGARYAGHGDRDGERVAGTGGGVGLRECFT